MTEYPDLMQHEEIGKLFPSDVQERAKKLLENVGSVGAYSHSKGCPAIRQDVADYIESELDR